MFFFFFFLGLQALHRQRLSSRASLLMYITSCFPMDTQELLLSSRLLNLQYSLWAQYLGTSFPLAGNAPNKADGGRLGHIKQASNALECMLYVQSGQNTLSLLTNEGREAAPSLDCQGEFKWIPQQRLSRGDQQQRGYWPGEVVPSLGLGLGLAGYGSDRAHGPRFLPSPLCFPLLPFPLHHIPRSLPHSDRQGRFLVVFFWSWLV